MVTGSILLVTLVEKFGEGGWVTVLITSLVVALCLLIRRHYDETKAKLREAEKLFGQAVTSSGGLFVLAWRLVLRRCSGCGRAEYDTNGTGRLRSRERMNLEIELTLASRSGQVSVATQTSAPDETARKT